MYSKALFVYTCTLIHAYNDIYFLIPFDYCANLHNWKKGL